MPINEILSILSIDPHDHFQILLLLMVVVWGAGRIFKLMGLPPMLGEILSGVLVGPSVLGLLDTTEFIKILAELGVFFLMFHSGLDTDMKEFFGRVKASMAVAFGGIFMTFLFSIFFFQFFKFHWVTAAFLSLMLALNSIPVIVSVLKSFKLKNSKIGHIVLGSSVVNELVLFIVFSVLIALAQSGEFSLQMLILVSVKVLLFVLGSLLIGLEILPFIGPKILNRSGSKGFTFALIIALFFGLFAEAIGLHMIIGAYVAGLFVRQEITKPDLMRKIEDRFYALSHSFLGPIFFASVGMMISFEAILSHPWFVLSLLLIVICGQICGTWLAALFLPGLTPKQTWPIGIALTGRGSTEIIMAQIGFSTVVTATGATILDKSLFASIVGLAFASTLLMPILLKCYLKISARF